MGTIQKGFMLFFHACCTARDAPLEMRPWDSTITIVAIRDSSTVMAAAAASSYCFVSTQYEACSMTDIVETVCK